MNSSLSTKVRWVMVPESDHSPRRLRPEDWELFCIFTWGLWPVHVSCVLVECKASFNREALNSYEWPEEPLVGEMVWTKWGLEQASKKPSLQLPLEGLIVLKWHEMLWQLVPQSCCTNRKTPVTMEVGAHHSCFIIFTLAASPPESEF
jgi:hypothetical protein